MTKIHSLAAVSFFLCSFLLSCLFFAAPASAAQKNPFKVDTALQMMAKHRTIGSFVSALKTQMSAEDAKYITAEYRKGGSFMRPLQMKVTGKNTYSFSGLQGSFLVRDNGNEITYRGLSFRFNENWSFERNAERIKKQLMEVHASNPWWMNAAVADDASERDDIRQSGIHLAGTLQYMTYLKTHNQYPAVSKLATSPNVDSLLSFGTDALISSVECGQMEGTEQSDKVTRITVKLDNHSQIEMDSVPAMGKSTTFSFADGHELPRDMSAENTSYAQPIFNDLVKNFCTLPQPKRDQLVADLKKVQSHYPVANGAAPANIGQ